MGRFSRRLVERRRDGTYAVRFGEDERALLASLPTQLASLLEVQPDDPWLQRLFPTAYPQDPDREAEWRLLMSVELHDRRRQQLEALAATAEAEVLDEEGLLAWAHATNDLRLYLGTRLDVGEETELDDFDEASDEAQLFLLYSWLGLVQEHIVDALSEGL